MKNKDVVFLCGDYPEDHITPDIGSDPNYIFKNDLSFEQVRLFDNDNNTVLVNSFVECEHYVNGTWNYYQGKDEIVYLTNINIFILVFTLSFLVVNFLKKRKAK